MNTTVSAFGYDGLYQLTAAYGQSFSYDPASRLINFNGLAYTPDTAHPHAADKVANVDRYDYDANGNQVVRNKGVANQEQVLTWDVENRLAAVTYTNRTSAGGGAPSPTTCNVITCTRIYFPLVMQHTPAERYSYDADGARVRKETKTEVTRYIGPHFEVTVAITNSQVLTTTKYYDFGGQRIAVRQNNTLSYLHGDHLGSTSVATSNTGAKTHDVRYYAYGGQRGTNSILVLPTDHTFTGQKLDKGTGLMYYGARYYDSALGMFISPDSIVPSPGDPLSLNRYAYVRNSPLRYTDPTGHVWRDDDSGGGWRWWELAPQPSFYGIRPGGTYGAGQIQIGHQTLPVYLPPTLVAGQTADGFLPLYQPWSAMVENPQMQACYPSPPGPKIGASPVGDYWYGESVAGRNAVRPRVWRSLAVLSSTNLSPEDAVAGIGIGLSETPEDLPLGPHASSFEVGVNGLQLLAYSLKGISDSRWRTTYYLQEHISEASYRVIVLAQQLRMNEGMYAAAGRLYPINWGPGPFINSAR